MTDIDPVDFGKLCGNVEAIMEAQKEDRETQKKDREADRDARKDLYDKVNKNTNDITKGKVIIGGISAVWFGFWAWVWKQL